jgi:hypothetical protein
VRVIVLQGTKMRVHNNDLRIKQFPILFPMVHILRQEHFPSSVAHGGRGNALSLTPCLLPRRPSLSLLLTFSTLSLAQCARAPSTEVITFYDAVRRVERVLSMTSTIICTRDNGRLHSDYLKVRNTNTKLSLRIAPLKQANLFYLMMIYYTR